MDYIKEHQKMWQSFIDNFSLDRLLPILQNHKDEYLSTLGIYNLLGDCFLCEYSYNISPDKNKIYDGGYCKYCKLKCSCFKSGSLYHKIYSLHYDLYDQYTTQGYCNKKDVEKYLDLLKLMKDMKG